MKKEFGNVLKYLETKTKAYINTSVENTKMQSIVSTFFGMCFPQAVTCNEDNDKVYILLYEACSA